MQRVRTLMDRGPERRSLNSDSMIREWVRYGDQVQGINRQYASDLRFHFYTNRNANLYRSESRL